MKSDILRGMTNRKANRMMTIQQFRQHFGEEEQCWKHLTHWRWPRGFVCSRCGGGSRGYMKAKRVHECGLGGDAGWYGGECPGLCAQPNSAPQHRVDRCLVELPGANDARLPACGHPLGQGPGGGGALLSLGAYHPVQPQEVLTGDAP